MDRSKKEIQVVSCTSSNGQRARTKSKKIRQPWQYSTATVEASVTRVIEDIYFKHFGKNAPDNVRSIEQIAKDKARKNRERKARKAATELSDKPEMNISES